MGKCRKSAGLPGKPSHNNEECRYCLYYRGKRHGCSLNKCSDEDKQYQARRRERAALREARRKSRNAVDDE